MSGFQIGQHIFAHRSLLSETKILFSMLKAATSFFVVIMQPNGLNLVDGRKELSDGSTLSRRYIAQVGPSFKIECKTTNKVKEPKPLPILLLNTEHY